MDGWHSDDEIMSSHVRCNQPHPFITNSYHIFPDDVTNEYWASRAQASLSSCSGGIIPRDDHIMDSRSAGNGT